jgi:endonuclease/exonuclease/phosphatase family metal-dependent hydrolase
VQYCYHELMARTTIKVISLNICGGVLIDEAVHFFYKERPDILMIQEVCDTGPAQVSHRFNCLQILRDSFGDYQSHFAPALTEKRDGDTLIWGNAIFSLHPIMNSDVRFFDIPYTNNWTAPRGDFSSVPRNVEHVKIKFDTGDLNVFNLHGIWGRDGRDNPRRLAMAQAIVKAAEGSKNVIVAGDFNMDADTEAMGLIAAQFKPVFPALASSFNMARKQDPVYAHLAVDGMFVSRSFNIQSAVCPKEDVSDHVPLIAVLEC